MDLFYSLNQLTEGVITESTKSLDNLLKDNQILDFIEFYLKQLETVNEPLVPMNLKNLKVEDLQFPKVWVTVIEPEKIDVFQPDQDVITEESEDYDSEDQTE